MPTINQKFEEGRLIPLFGVYYSSCEIDGTLYPSVTNIGSRPTVNPDISDITCETHIIGSSLNLYGKKALVNFYRYARPEIKFGNTDQLKEKILEDMRLSKVFFDTFVKDN